MKRIAIGIAMFLGLAALMGMAAALNPLNGNDWDYDPDGDRLTNLDEFLAGSDPNNWDSDGDGLPDGWEVENSLDPTNPADAHEDNDYFGGEEYASYTQVDPPYDNYAEYFRLAGVDDICLTLPSSTIHLVWLAPDTVDLVQAAGTGQMKQH